MNKNIYLKGICYSTSGIYLPDEQRYSLNEILDNGEIVSARLLGSKKPNGFSGLDYISLCDYEKRDLVNGGIKNYNAFYQYIVHSLSLAFPKEKLDAIVPKLIASLYKNKHRDSIMESFGMVEERYSDLPDEVQVKDIITLDDMCGITFPTKSFINLLTFRSKKTKIRLLREEIERIKKIIRNQGYDVGVYDMYSLDEMNDETIEKLVLKH